MRYSLEPLLRRFFYWYGGVVYSQRWLLFILPLLLTPLFCIGFLWFGDLNVDDPAYVFTPRDARWKKELAVFTTNWPLEENKFLPGKSFESKRFVNVLVKAKDRGNVLRPFILDEIQFLNTLIMQNVSVSTYDGKFNLTYQDLCLSYDWVCGANEHIEMFRQMSKDTPAYLGTAIGDIVLNKSDNTVLEAHVTQLFYFLKQEPASVRKYSTDFEYAVEKFLLHEFRSDLITYSFAHYQSLEDGLNENAERFVPNFVISFTSLSIFCIICSFTLKKGSSGLDFIRSKPYLACAGLFNTLLSLGSAFGVMLMIGVPYNVINTIIPFLIIAIGIDDMFIMNACWDQTDHSLPTQERMAQMMEKAGVAVSITNITDILSFLIGCITELPGIEVFCLYAFASVAFCYVYQLTYFAGFMAIMGEAEREKRHCFFLYKLTESEPQKTNTIYAVNSESAITEYELRESPSLSTKMSETSMDSSCPSYAADKRTTNNGFASTQPTSAVFAMNSNVDGVPLGIHGTIAKLPRPDPSARNTQPPSENAIHRFFGQKYAPFILNDGVRFVVCVTYIVYIVVAVMGCFNFREGLEPKNLVTSTHYIASYFTDIKLFWRIGPQLHVAVLKPPNFTDPIQREQLMAMVRAFEDTDYTLGREGTVFFFLEYLNYLDQLNAELENTDKIWNVKLRSWLKFTGGSNQWETDIVYNKTTDTISAFRFQIALKNIVEPNQHKLAAKLLRKIADEQPFNVQIFHEAFPFADQYLIILPSTYRNIIISLLCMTCIAFLLIPSLPSAIIIVASIVSICVGVFGYMTFWGVNLDAISMISVTASRQLRGFLNLDYHEHWICCRFVRTYHVRIRYSSRRSSRTSDRSFGALGLANFPGKHLNLLCSCGFGFQGAASTITGITVLYTVDAYIILTMFKTIWLTMVLGVIHGLLFIPVMFSLIPLGFFRIYTKRPDPNTSDQSLKPTGAKTKR
ncbi:Patched domain-containing protein 3 [Aphelenchoides besseyi]|nr:Patched domain-containing protein 3 [Aphelenchoides besseyi]